MSYASWISARKILHRGNGDVVALGRGRLGLRGTKDHGGCGDRCGDKGKKLDLHDASASTETRENVPYGGPLCHLCIGTVDGTLPPPSRDRALYCASNLSTIGTAASVAKPLSIVCTTPSRPMMMSSAWLPPGGSFHCPRVRSLSNAGKVVPLSSSHGTSLAAASSARPTTTKPWSRRFCQSSSSYPGNSRLQALHQVVK